jgi:hypothetical protein
VELTDAVVLKPGFPCLEAAVKQPVVLHLVAAQWVNADILLHSQSQKKSTADLMGIAHFDNLRSIFNGSWDVNSQILNISEVSFLAGVQKPKLHEYLPPTGAFTKWLMILWNILLTLGLVWMVCRPAGFGFLPVATASPSDKVAGLLFNWEDYWHDVYMVYVLMVIVAVFAFVMILWKFTQNADLCCGRLGRRRTIRRLVGRPRFQQGIPRTKPGAVCKELQPFNPENRTASAPPQPPPIYPDLSE